MRGYRHVAMAVFFSAAAGIGSAPAPLAVEVTQNTKRLMPYQVFELTFQHKGKYDDPTWDVGIEVTFTSPDAKRYTVGGFFYGSSKPQKPIIKRTRVPPRPLDTGSRAGRPGPRPSSGARRACGRAPRSRRPRPRRRAAATGRTPARRRPRPASRCARAPLAGRRGVTWPGRGSASSRVPRDQVLTGLTPLIEETCDELPAEIEGRN